MKVTPIRIVILLAALAVVGAVILAPYYNSRYVRIANVHDSRDPDAVDVLFVGNSHTFYNDIPRLVQQLVPTGQPQMWFTALTSPGKSLSWHETEGTLERIREREWDVVILQGSSTEAFSEPAQMKRGAAMLGASAPGARVIMYMVWARHPTYDPGIYQAGWYSPNYDAAVEHLLEVNRDTGFVVAPVGVAWQHARESTDIELYIQDGNHANLAGSYLAALVLYAAIYKADPAKTTWKPDGLSDAMAKALRASAASVR